MGSDQSITGRVPQAGRGTFPGLTGIFARKDFAILLISILLGVFVGLVAILFNKMIEWVNHFFFTVAARAIDLPLLIILVPALGGLSVGLIIRYFGREARGHGVPEVMAAIALRGGVIQPRVGVIKAITSAITIGSGGSAGKEGPIVQIGAVIGSNIARLFHLTKEDTTTLVAAGAAGGLAAVFNTPIAGVIFAVEIILGDLGIQNIIPIVITSVTANAVMQLLVGAEYTFQVPGPFAPATFSSIPVYILLGVLAAFTSAIFIRALFATEDFCQRRLHLPAAIRPALGALLVGLIGFIYPRVTPAFTSIPAMPHIFGSGYGPINDALNGQYLLAATVILLVLKLLATVLTLGSGGSGGYFAPSLFMGAMLGASVGLAFNQIMPSFALSSSALTLVGMAAVFAGITMAPITATIMVFELTGDYTMILPLMFAVAISSYLTRFLLDGESIDTIALAHKGIRLQRGRDIDVMQGITVGEIMTGDFESVPPAMTMEEFSRFVSTSPQNGFPIIDGDGRFLGIISLTDLNKAIQSDTSGDTPVSRFGSPASRVIRVTPDQTMEVALSLMARHNLGRLPVVSPDDEHHLLGLIRREEIISAYEQAIMQRAVLQNRVERMGLRNIDGMEFVEVTIQPGDPIIGQSLRQVAVRLPEHCVLISIRRDGRVTVPHGDTVFKAGDIITAYTDADEASQLMGTL